MSKIGRNDPCPCRSGKKFKKCCGDPTRTRSVRQTEAPIPPIEPHELDAVRACIERFKGFDLHVLSIDDVKEELTFSLKGFQLVAPRFEPGLKLYRARNMFGAGPPKYLSEIGAPPAHLVRTNGRCNRAGESIFYCSSQQNAPFFEVGAKSGERLVISE